ncbi:apolipoprotein L2 [Lepisosteus oculatus]|uniref:apolipoprotein L2 n=1 Tax=Lepisosteus oculatus TaxID=7918 RepID=UPI0035F50257
MDQVLERAVAEKMRTYASETLKYIQTVTHFLSQFPKWLSARKEELDKLRDLRDRAQKLDVSFHYVRNAEHKGKAFGEYLKSSLMKITASKRTQELEKELGGILEETLAGLAELDPVLEAVGKLSVTSLPLFTDEYHQAVELNAPNVPVAIAVAILVAPFLLHFQRRAEDLFLPDLANIEMLVPQLETYLQNAEELCKKLKIMRAPESIQQPVFPHLHSDLTTESLQEMYDHLEQLNKIREDEHLRITFLFKDNALKFIGLLSARNSRMRKYLQELEETANLLDKVEKGTAISSVTGSSVGLVSGALSIAGLALAPVTAGLSLPLFLSGVVLGVTSALGSVATGVTGIAMNIQQVKRFHEVSKNYAKDAAAITEFIHSVASNKGQGVDVDDANVDHKAVIEAAKMVVGLVSVGKGIDTIVDCASAVNLLKTERLVASAAKVALQEGKAARSVPAAVDIVDIGRAAKGTPLALPKAARVGFIAANAVFMGLDLFIICKDSVSLAQGKKNEVGQEIRRRVRLLRDELDCWEQIHSSVCRGIWRFRKSQEILQRSLYPSNNS